MKTLLLDQSAWDLVLDASGNIALASEPYALAQDVASAIKLFAGEAIYDTTRGVPYFDTILGQSPPVTVFQEAMKRAALTVPGVLSATCTITQVADRVVTGVVTFRDDTGRTGMVAL